MSNEATQFGGDLAPTGVRQFRTLEEVKAYAAIKTIEMVDVLTSIALNPEASNGDRTTAAMAVLDRAWGKPKQAQEFQMAVTVSLDELRTKLADRLSRIRARNAPRALPGLDSGSAVSLASVGEE